MQSAEQQGANTLNAGLYTGNTPIGVANALASGDIGAANAWNGMLSGIGSAANSALTGGLTGGFGGGTGSIVPGTDLTTGEANFSQRRRDTAAGIQSRRPV